ncbi:monoamine oxidase [Dietzia sp. UCD-THP]|uniref:flavin monoamine oxidase family protein n=1 Tax=Dietzia sp. UCD-THP TaxID=1292020 RepID=UPI00037AA2D1|nr:FAD-dependent oxidoreductase [Dietzia sp. UCD-THP]EYT58764.1 monoamine oxidase [Dietzia sp. UCD-THP]
MSAGVDVIVVGAGLAGLTAARRLVEAGRTVRVLEARDRVGGRTLNHVLDDGQVVEAGGQFVGPTQDHVLGLAEELGVQTFPANTLGDTVYVHGSRSRRFRGDIPPDRLALADIALATTRLGRTSGEIDVAAPWEHPDARRLDEQSLATWLRRGAIGSGGVELVEVLLGSAFGAAASETSALSALAYIAGAGDEIHRGTLDRMISVAGGAQESRFVGGSQLISHLMAEELGDDVTLGAPARRIEHHATGVTVTTDAGVFHGDQVIVAVPPHLAAEIEWSPQLPAHQDALFRRMTFGTLMKCEAVYERPFWREDGLSGQGVFRGGGQPVCSMFDNTPPSGSPGILMGFVGGAGWRTWAPRSARQRGGAVLQSFARVVGPAALAPVGYFEKDWTAERWTRGGPTAVLGPGVLTTLGRWRDRPLDSPPSTPHSSPHSRVHWAGAEHSDYWNGYMDGAVRSGQAAARAAIAHSGGLS